MAITIGGAGPIRITLGPPPRPITWIRLKTPAQVAKAQANYAALIAAGWVDPYASRMGKPKKNNAPRNITYYVEKRPVVMPTWAEFEKNGQYLQAEVNKKF